MIGTCLSVSTSCQNCGKVNTWLSQKFMRSMPLGNLVVAASVFFSGCSPVKALNCLQIANIAGLSLTSYNLIQGIYLVPATMACWTRHRDNYLEGVRASNKSLILGGDARCSSPGHTAKYGSYTFMDLDNSKVVDVQLVQVWLYTYSQAENFDFMTCLVLAL